jgi:hypothetical protein
MNIFSLQAFRAFDHLELDRLPLGEGAESTRLDCRKMHKQVTLSRVTADKAITLAVVKPFHYSFFHCDCLLCC